MTAAPKLHVVTRGKEYIYEDTRLRKGKAIFTQAEAEKNVLTDMVVNKGLSIYEAAVKCDIDELRAHRILFNKKPTDKQISRAFEIYDKGLSMIIACVSSGVSPAIFKSLNKQRLENTYKPYRW